MIERIFTTLGPAGEGVPTLALTAALALDIAG